MKIGIMTWYTYRNYGSALQASSLNFFIQKLGYEPLIIQYQPKGSTIEQKHINIKSITNKIIEKLKSINKTEYISEEKETLFSDYLSERINETAECNTYPELYSLNEECDAFVCGSDQIWSPLCYDDKYFLSFVENSRKMISYAPSIGSTEIKNSYVKEKMKQQLSRFNYLSVREKQGAKIIKELCGKDAEVVLDPTFLLSGKEWDSYAGVDQVKKIETPYIICYFLGDVSKYKNYVHRISKQYNMLAYIIPITQHQKNSSNAVPFEVGPSEFVSLIKNANHVCTDSFHGMAFSINYNIPFTSFKRFTDDDPKNQNSRIFNILNMLKLQERLVNPKDYSKMDVLADCNFSEANIILQKQRELSENYLKTALEETTSCNNNDVAQVYKITDLCCGCGACAAVCPNNAIKIVKSDEGFEHYSIDKLKCTQCGLCKTVCPFNNPSAPSIKDSLALYAMKSESLDVLKKSSSGGIGYEIARMYNEKGAWISGCEYDSEIDSAKHILIEPYNKDKLINLQGSKYIQSILSNAMNQIKELEQDDNLVFFGTPCQVAAVDKLLCKMNRRDNAILIDLICHGVPSYHLWNRYLYEQTQCNHIGEHPVVDFRSEVGGSHRMLLLLGNGYKNIKKESKDDFYAFFRRGLCDMKTCFDCPYREHSAADIRIGDYWGPRFEKNKTGVSMVIANTNTGNELVKELSDINICSKQKFDLSEYWTVQFPYNQNQPVFRDKLIHELSKGEKSVSDLRKEYCTSYDTIERLSKIRTKIKKIRPVKQK